MGFTSSLVAISALAVGAFAAPAAEPIDVSKLVKRAQAPNYNQDYIASGANVQYSPNVAAGTFSVNYNTQQDFVVGLGWTTGDTTPITYSGTFSASGVGLLSIYGWSTNPVVEYYIMEDPIGYPKQGTQKGTVVCDGATYDIWEHQQVNQPSIQGTSTFNQYISIRESPRTSGTVTLSCHFNAWAALGMKLGTMNYQTLSVESWSGSGKGSFTVSKGAATGGGSGGTPTSSAAAAPTSPASGGGSGSGGAAQWGQCGGIGWTGPTTCVSPYTCKVSNSYYSQCQ